MCRQSTCSQSVSFRPSIPSHQSHSTPIRLLLFSMRVWQCRLLRRLSSSAFDAHRVATRPIFLNYWSTLLYLVEHLCIPNKLVDLTWHQHEFDVFGTRPISKPFHKIMVLQWFLPRIAFIYVTQSRCQISTLVFLVLDHHSWVSGQTQSAGTYTVPKEKEPRLVWISLTE
jgi:hypothetical protein